MTHTFIGGAADGARHNTNNQDAYKVPIRIPFDPNKPEPLFPSVETYTRREIRTPNGRVFFYAVAGMTDTQAITAALARYPLPLPEPSKS